MNKVASQPLVVFIYLMISQLSWSCVLGSVQNSDLSGKWTEWLCSIC